MNRQQRRLSDSFHRKAVTKAIGNSEWTTFEDRTSEALPKFTPGTLIGFFVNNIFSVQVFSVDGKKVAGIRRNDQGTMISWETKQRIKNEVLGKDVSAIEVFPKHEELIDQANMYWLWIADCSAFDLKKLKV